MASSAHPSDARKHRSDQSFGSCDFCGRKFDRDKGEQTFAKPSINAAGHNELDVICRDCAVKYLGEDNVKKLLVSDETREKVGG